MTLLTDALFDALSTVESPTGVIARVRTPAGRGGAPRRAARAAARGDPGPGQRRHAAAQRRRGRGASTCCCRRTARSRGRPRCCARDGRAFRAEHRRGRRSRGAFSPAIAARRWRSTRPRRRSVYDLDLRGPLALLVGNEGAGAQPGAAARRPRCARRIPMPGPVESLNAGTAGSIASSRRCARGCAAPSAMTDHAHRSYRYYEFVMAAFVVILVCSNLIGPAKIAQVRAAGGGRDHLRRGRALLPDLVRVRRHAHRGVRLRAQPARDLGGLRRRSRSPSFMAWVVVALPPAPFWKNQPAYEIAFGIDLAHRARLDGGLLLRRVREFLRAREDEDHDARDAGCGRAPSARRSSARAWTPRSSTRSRSTAPGSSRTTSCRW